MNDCVSGRKFSTSITVHPLYTPRRAVFDAQSYNLMRSQNPAARGPKSTIPKNIEFGVGRGHIRNLLPPVAHYFRLDDWDFDMIKIIAVYFHRVSDLTFTVEAILIIVERERERERVSLR
jgi:hypothetical protein